MRFALVTIVAASCGCGAGDEVSVCFAQLAAIRPVDKASNVPLNVQLVARRDGCSGAGRATLQLETGGSSVLLATPETRFETSGAHEWTVVRPATELLPDTDYVMHAIDSDGNDLIGGFRTGTARREPSDDAAGLEVLDVDCTSGGVLADWRACTYWLRFTPPPSAANDRGLYHVDGLEVTSRHAALSLVTFGRDAEGPFEASFTLSEPRGQSPRCFKVVYEDAAGHLHPLSSEACSAEDGGPGGCNSTGASVPSLAAIAFVLAARRRR